MIKQDGPVNLTNKFQSHRLYLVGDKLGMQELMEVKSAGEQNGSTVCDVHLPCSRVFS
jgi:hypothetical protein